MALPAFSPSEDDLDYSRRVVAAFEEAVRSGSGAIAIGELVDLPIVERARRMIATYVAPPRPGD